MKNQFLGLLLCILFLEISHASQTNSDVSSCYLPTQSNVAYSKIIELPTGSPNHVINYASGDLRFGELWLPERKSDERFPLVVLIHGGCWLNSFDIKHTHALSTALSQSGYAVWSLEYRRTGDDGGGWPGSLNDVVAGINFVEQLADYPINQEQIVLAGHSAGGHLALLAAKIVEQPISSVIGLAAISDIEKYALGENSCQTATSQFMGGSPATLGKTYASANPLKTLTDSLSTPPNNTKTATVLIHGSQDNIVPFEQSRNYVNQANENDSAARLIRVEGAGHFDMIHPGTESYQRFVRTLAEVLRE